MCLSEYVCKNPSHTVLYVNLSGPFVTPRNLLSDTDPDRPFSAFGDGVSRGEGRKSTKEGVRQGTPE